MTGEPLDVAQGKYVNTSIGARLSRGAIGLPVDVNNLLDVPRRVRVGVDLRF